MITLQRENLDTLLNVLQEHGYRNVGPTVRDGAIVLDQIRSSADLPIGLMEQQDGGSSTLTRRDDKAFFGFTVSGQSWKQFLFPSRECLFTATKNGKGWSSSNKHVDDRPHAFVGVRPCELAAIQIQDRVFLSGESKDTAYQSRRKGIFIVAVNCSFPGNNCFCASLDTGPRATIGYDIVLTEIIESGRYYFTAESASEIGAKVLEEVPHETASATDREHVDRAMTQSVEQMGKSLQLEGLQQLFIASREHPSWDDVAKRCLACANCTMVCPTCFCSTVEDITDLSGDHAERWRRWDSCFSLDFARVAGGNFRSSVRSRYRQWITHKFSSWVDQFGMPGCVGCGRCITWCPVGIDITEHAATLRNGAGLEQSESKN